MLNQEEEVAHRVIQSQYPLGPHQRVNSDIPIIFIFSDLLIIELFLPLSSDLDARLFKDVRVGAFLEELFEAGVDVVQDPGVGVEEEAENGQDEVGVSEFDVVDEANEQETILGEVGKSGVRVAKNVIEDAVDLENEGEDLGQADDEVFGLFVAVLPLLLLFFIVPEIGEFLPHGVKSGQVFDENDNFG